MEQKIITEEKRKEVIYLFPVLAILFFLPFIVFVKQVRLVGFLYRAWTGSKTTYNMFTYYRSIFLILVSLMTFVLLIMYFYENTNTVILKLIKNKKIILLFLYLLLAVLSTLNATYFEVALFGFVDRYEGLILIMGYIIFFTSAYVIVKNELQIKVIMVVLLTTSTVLSIVGIFQYFGFDLLKFGISSGILLPSKLYDMRLDLLLPESINSIIMTFYNSNNVGSYMAIMLPFSIGLFLYSSQKRNTIILGIYSCLMFANWVGCRSRAGIVSGISSVILLIILTRSGFLRKKKRLLIIIPYVIIIFIMNYSSGGLLLNKYATLFPKEEKVFFNSEYGLIQDIIFYEDHIKISTENQILNMKIIDNKPVFFNQENIVLETHFQNNLHYFENENYSDYSFCVKDNNLVVLKLKNIKMNFYFENRRIYLIGKNGELIDKIKKPESFGFNDLEHFGSGRGYLWSRTIPLLKNTLLIGNGPDVFPFYFPQDDYIGKMNNFGTPNIVVDKPHNFYIQVAHDTGIVSLVVLLVFFILYFVESIKLYLFNKSNEFLVFVGKTITCSMLGYLIAAVFNDSVIYVAPYFWIMLGIGCSINYMLKSINENDFEKLRKSKFY